MPPRGGTEASGRVISGACAAPASGQRWPAATPPELYQIGATQVRCLLHEHGKDSGISDPDLSGAGDQHAGSDQ